MTDDAHAIARPRPLGLVPRAALGLLANELLSPVDSGIGIAVRRLSDVLDISRAIGGREK